ncbi:MAG: response regulator [Leptospiraceae bacterium]|nr:response regulator [Leptospiraceae bacterium]
MTEIITEGKLFSFRNIYKIFLVTILLTILGSQGIVQFLIYTTKYDSNRINISGRQRMLSQNLSKNILKLYIRGNLTEEEWKEIIHLKELWKSSHVNLQLGNDALSLPQNTNEKAKILFDKIQPEYVGLLEILEKAINDKQISKTDVEECLLREKNFLPIMDEIVGEFNSENILKISKLQWIESGLSIFTIIILILEIFLLYKPIINKLRKDNHKLKLQNSNLEEFSFILSHKVRNHVANIQSMIQQIELNGKNVLTNYLEEFKKSISQLNSEIDVLNQKAKIFVPISNEKFSKEILNVKKNSIIVIDDDKLTNILTKKFLLMKNRDFEVTIFENAKDAIEYILNLANQTKVLPNILLDLNMPIMNGWEFIEAIEKKGVYLNVYILTSSIDVRDINRSKKYRSVKAFLTKPLTLDKIPNFIVE